MGFIGGGLSWVGLDVNLKRKWEHQPHIAEAGGAEDFWPLRLVRQKSVRGKAAGKLALQPQSTVQRLLHRRILDHGAPPCALEIS